MSSPSHDYHNRRRNALRAAVSVDRQLWVLRRYFGVWAQQYIVWVLNGRKRKGA